EHKQLLLQLVDVRNRLAANRMRSRATNALETLNDMLGFYGAGAVGAAPAIPAKGVEILKRIGKHEPLYLRPGQSLDMPGLSPGRVRVHVLGPPRIPGNELLQRTNPRPGESYDLALAAASVQAGKLLDAINHHVGKTSQDEQQYPFSDRLKSHR